MLVASKFGLDGRCIGGDLIDNDLECVLRRFSFNFGQDRCGERLDIRFRGVHLGVGGQNVMASPGGCFLLT